MRTRQLQSLKTILGRRLIIIAAAVILANIAFVAFFDASDRSSLISDVTTNELGRLELALKADPEGGGDLNARVSDIYERHPEAYAFVVVDAGGRPIAGANVDLFPDGALKGVALAPDWLAWPNKSDTLPVIASHTIVAGTGADAAAGGTSSATILFMMRSDPANLIRWEIWDEFSGHVLLPLAPITILLIGGTWLMMRRVLAPVAEAAGWARSIRPGKPLPPFPDQGRSTEIEDLMDAVRRSLDRLNSELDAEQRRAGEAAHALRTPVAVLVARLDELRDGPQTDQLRADVLALSRTVTQFLSSAGADRLELDEADRADLGEVAEGVVADLAPFALRRGTEIEVVVHEAPCLVHGSKNAIALALTNLVENAIYHGGSALVSVTVGPGPQISVRDRGPGLPPGDSEALFKPFWRGPRAERGGAGLGLAIVARIQRSHGGGIEASDAPGGGAEFRLSYRAA
ncbi:HAMP domain-containing sensor histidine kinase [Pseudoxanthobacter sp. M-2]|uniref:sensor histidine kinase n=1 Tax=Pseudoxanthobacter sp. M-2 TaxID=3078754 RepID=UPI0038FC7A37